MTRKWLFHFTLWFPYKMFITCRCLSIFNDLNSYMPLYVADHLSFAQRHNRPNINLLSIGSVRPEVGEMLMEIRNIAYQEKGMSECLQNGHHCAQASIFHVHPDWHLDCCCCNHHLLDNYPYPRDYSANSCKDITGVYAEKLVNISSIN